MSGRRHARVFFALWPDAWMARTWHRQGERLQAECGGRLMRANTLHITLAFLGAVERPRIDELLALGERNPLPRVRFACTEQGWWEQGWWEKRQLAWLAPPRVPEALVAFQRGFVQRVRYAGLACDARPFVPHVTLLRRAERAPRERWFRGAPPWQPAGLVLLETQRDERGTHYLRLGEWPVAG